MGYVANSSSQACVKTKLTFVFILDLTAEEIGTCSQRFWDHQQDPVFAIDPGLANLVTCSLNLFVGTLYPLLPGRPHLKPLVDQALRGEIFGNLFLSELGHGLDIQNLETTATKVADGFILNTPSDGATKYVDDYLSMDPQISTIWYRFMAPTLPIAGFARWGIVMSRLVVGGEDRGVHPFLVQTSDEHGMRPGVTNVCLPIRSGSLVDYSMTTFRNVHLAENAFLGVSLEKPKDKRTLLHKYIWRIPVGTSAIGMPAVVSCKMMACIASDYSFRRHIGGQKDKMPIISFRTQSLPVLYSVAISHVFSAWMPRVAAFYMDKRNDFETWTSLGVVFKATVNRLVAQATRDLGERLGAQGLFPQNHLGVLEVRLCRALISAFTY